MVHGDIKFGILMDPLNFQPLMSVSTLKLQRMLIPGLADAEAAFNNLPFNSKIAILSAKGVGVERYQWQHRESLWPDTPPWHSSSSSLAKLDAPR